MSAEKESKERGPRPAVQIAYGPSVMHPIPGERERLSGLTRQQVYRLLRQGLLESVSVEGRIFIPDESLRALPAKLPKHDPQKSAKGLRLSEARRRKAAAAGAA